ncbi:hypothetical protein [Streptomyces sp. NPDC013489]|uniref:hypothetical protein n=1 Tax=Streptomyces sp. NPDC013489 TaxID=3155606 RepID=UPI00340E33D2
MTVPFLGALRVDLEGQRARYECLRPNCPHRVEGPVYAADTFIPGPGGVPTRGGAAEVADFIDRVRGFHLAQYHPGEITQ